jgi:hypothetical protein
MPSFVHSMKPASAVSRRAMGYAANAASVVSLVVAVGCSSSSASPSTGDDASTPDSSVIDSGIVDTGIVDAAMPPLGVPITTCAGCAVCGGLLLTATTGTNYCTVDCTTDSDCPAGSNTACIPNIMSAAANSECIRTCQADSDCTLPFVCRHDLPTAGGYCWSPYRETDAITPFPDAGPDATTAPDSGTTPDAGPSPDAATDSGASTTGDAADDGPAE